MTEPLPDGYVIHLPPPARRPPHQFSDPVFVAADPSHGRYTQTERTCHICGAVKITVHGPDNQHWREWRIGDAQLATEYSLPCVPAPGIAGAVA